MSPLVCKVTGYWSSFFAVFGRQHAKNKVRVQYPSIFTSRLVNNLIIGLITRLKYPTASKRTTLRLKLVSKTATLNFGENQT